MRAYFRVYVYIVLGDHSYMKIFVPLLVGVGEGGTLNDKNFLSDLSLLKKGLTYQKTNTINFKLSGW